MRVNRNSYMDRGNQEDYSQDEENEINKVEEDIPQMVAAVEEATSPRLKNTVLGPGLDSVSSAGTMPGPQPTMSEEPQVLDLSLKRQSPRGRLRQEASMPQQENELNNVGEEIPKAVASVEEATHPRLENTVLGPGLDSASSSGVIPGPQPTMMEEPQILDLSLKRQSISSRLLHEDSMPQPADRSEVKEGRIYRTSPEGVEVRKESGCDGDGTQKQNQIGQTRDMLHQHQKGVIFEEEMATVTNKRLNILQSSNFAPNVPLRKIPVKCRTGNTGGKPRQSLQCGKSSAWIPKDRRVHTGEKSDMSLKPEKCFSLGSATEVSQPLISEGKPNKSMESAGSFKRTFEPEIHQRTHKGEKVYKCNECGKGFKRKSHLRQHQLIHTGEKPFPCKQCGRRFRQKGSLVAHERIHSGKKPYKCNKCGKRFRYLSSFTIHQRTHSKKKPYHCEDCGKRFNHRSNLVVHKRIHTGEKPYSCQVCGKHFSDPSSLNSHQQTHSGKKPYHCEECGKMFRYRSNLVAHKRVHTREKPFSCQDCGKCFSHRSTLKTHKRIHTGEKPYSCQDCGKCFSDHSNLRTHKRNHTAEKPFQCKECEKTFSRRCNLVAHQQSHSREKPVSS